MGSEALDWLEKVAVGGMGEVYRGRCRRTGAALAIKLLAPVGPDPERRQLRRFEREVAALRRIEHPNVVPLRAAGWRDDRPFLATDWIEGASLAEQMRRESGEAGAARSERARRRMTAVAEALEVCHSAGLIHRDLKPDNIMIRERDGAPILIDFGLARPLAWTSLSDDLTRSGELLGTPAFASPEQIDPKSFGEPGPPADVWGFGATLYFCLTGRAPFEGVSQTELCSRVLNAEPPRPRSLDRGVPRPLERLTLACLKKPPASRPTLPQVLRRLRGERRRRWPLALAGAGALAAALAWLARPELPPPALELRRIGPAITAAATVELRGRVRPGWRLRIDGRPIVLGGDGRFTAELPLEGDGPRRLRAVVLDPEGRPRARRVVELYVDRSPPILKLPACVVAEGRSELILEVQDHRAARVEWRSGSEAGQAPVEPGGRAAIALPNWERPRGLRVAAIDAAGNRSDEARCIYAAPAVRAYRRALLRPEPWARARALLAASDRWSAAASEEREEAARALWFRLQERFDYLGIETFECGGLSAPVARYRHRGSGLVLHLIPGGEVYESSYARLRRLLSLIREADDSSLQRMFRRDWFSSETMRGLLDQLGLAVRLKAFDGVADLEAYLNTERGGCEKLRGVAGRILGVIDRGDDPDMFGGFGGGLPRRARRAVSPFLIGQAEVSEAAWARLTGAPPPSGGELPMVGLDGGAAARSLAAVGLRLPRLDEWRLAAAAGARGRYFWGDRPRDQEAWHAGNADGRRSTRAHLGRGNAFGLRDVLGNVQEMGAPQVLGMVGLTHPWMGGDARMGIEALCLDLFDDSKSPQGHAFLGLRAAASLPP